MKTGFFASAIALSISFASANARADVHTFDQSTPTAVIEVKVEGKAARTELANLGYALEDMRSDRVYIYAHAKDAERLKSLGWNVNAYAFKPEWTKFSAHAIDAASQYTNYTGLQKKLTDLQTKSSGLVTMMSLGRSLEGRDVPMIRVSGKSVAEAESAKLPVVFYMGCHHAREHLSVEAPLAFAQYLVDNYGKNPDVTRLVDTREIYFAPMVNPDGHTYDWTGQEKGKMWRKNRRPNSDGSMGVDLNRNYSFGWGTGGSSTDGSSDVYMGAAPFSEPETQNVRDFVNSQPRMTTLLTFHTFSELVLYPWGGSNDKVGENGKGTVADHDTFVKMANDMAAWNHYTPEQSSDLYIASGDTTDWAYGTHGIFAFTFEMSPTSMWEGGFYPGNAAIKPAIEANLKPMLYMLEFADNPHRVKTAKIPNFLLTPSKVGVAAADFRDAMN